LSLRYYPAKQAAVTGPTHEDPAFRRTSCVWPSFENEMPLGHAAAPRHRRPQTRASLRPHCNSP